MISLISRISLLVWMLAAFTSVQAASLGALMKSAIDAPDGRASGVLNDGVAALVARTTGSATPVTAQVETIHVFRQDGCRRLKATLSQAVAGTSGAVFPFEMNLCRDGAIPREGVDIEQAAARFGALQSVR